MLLKLIKDLLEYFDLNFVNIHLAVHLLEQSFEQRLLASSIEIVGVVQNLE